MPRIISFVVVAILSAFTLAACKTTDGSLPTGAVPLQIGGPVSNAGMPPVAENCNHIYPGYDGPSDYLPTVDLAQRPLYAPFLSKMFASAPGSVNQWFIEVAQPWRDQRAVIFFAHDYATDSQGNIFPAGCERLVARISSGKLAFTSGNTSHVLEFESASYVLKSSYNGGKWWEGGVRVLTP